MVNGGNSSFVLQDTQNNLWAMGKNNNNRFGIKGIEYFKIFVKLPFKVEGYQLKDFSIGDKSLLLLYENDQQKTKVYKTFETF